MRPAAAPGGGGNLPDPHLPRAPPLPRGRTRFQRDYRDLHDPPPGAHIFTVKPHAIIPHFDGLSILLRLLVQIQNQPRSIRGSVRVGSKKKLLLD